MTPLDDAHAAMRAAPDEVAPRMRFYQRLLDAELLVLLAGEVAGEALRPRTFESQGRSFVPVFDSDERLGAFVECAAPYAAVPGRILVAMLRGQGLGLALNLAVAPSETLLDPDAVDWLDDLVEQRTEAVVARPTELRPPTNVPEALLEALEARLIGVSGPALTAYLARAICPRAGGGLVLAFVDAEPGAKDLLLQAVGEVLAHSGAESGLLDVTFVAGTDEIAGRLTRAAHRPAAAGGSSLPIRT